MDGEFQHQQRLQLQTYEIVHSCRSDIDGGGQHTASLQHLGDSRSILKCKIAGTHDHLAAICNHMHAAGVRKENLIRIKYSWKHIPYTQSVSDGNWLWICIPCVVVDSKKWICVLQAEHQTSNGTGHVHLRTFGMPEWHSDNDRIAMLGEGNSAGVCSCTYYWELHVHLPDDPGQGILRLIGPEPSAGPCSTTHLTAMVISRSVLVRALYSSHNILIAAMIIALPLVKM